MSSIDKNRFENFCTLDLGKGPGGSCEWLARIASDRTLTYNEVGILFLLGERLRGSSFGFEQVLCLQECDYAYELRIDRMTIIASLISLEEKGYISATWHKERSPEAVRAYLDYIIDQAQK